LCNILPFFNIILLSKNYFFEVYDMGRITSVSLCMIVKNEEVFLDTALKSVKSVLPLGEMVVVDTGSTDKTKDIALQNGTVVFDFEWCDNFSAARNFAADKAKNDWIFILDADEEIIGAEAGELIEFLSDVQAVGAITRVEMSDKANTYESRLYNRKKYRYEGSIHEQITPLGNHNKQIKTVPVLIAHHGYLPEFKRVNGKLERNEMLLKKELAKTPDDSYFLHQLGKSYFCNNRDLLQACSCFEKALSSKPDARFGYVYDIVECYGYALLNTGQYEKALKLMVDYAAYYRGNPHFRFLSAHIYQNNGMLVEAVECYESCLGVDMADYKGITSYLSYYNIGVVLECVDMVDDAIQMYQNCGDYEPAVKRLAVLLK